MPARGLAAVVLGCALVLATRPWRRWSAGAPGARGRANGPIGDADAGVRAADARIHAAEEARREAEGEPPSPERRRLLTWIPVGAGAFIAAVLGLPFAGFVLKPTPEPVPRVWRRVAAVDDLAVGQTARVRYTDPGALPWAGFAAETAAWLRRDAEESFVAFTVYCTHTGCPVRWEESAALFLCPCHGGAFYRDGGVASGPPPAPLTRYPVRVQDGVVEILTTPIPGRI